MHNLYAYMGTRYYICIDTHSRSTQRTMSVLYFIEMRFDAGLRISDPLAATRECCLLTMMMLCPWYCCALLMRFFLLLFSTFIECADAGKPQLYVMGFRVVFGLAIVYMFLVCRCKNKKYKL